MLATKRANVKPLVESPSTSVGPTSPTSPVSPVAEPIYTLENPCPDWKERNKIFLAQFEDWNSHSRIREEIESNPDLYSGDKPIALYSFPPYLKLGVDRLRSLAKCKFGALNSLMAHTGLNALKSTPEYKAYCALCEEIKISDRLSMKAESVLLAMRGSMDRPVLQISPSCPFGTTEKYRFKTSDEMKSQLYGAASKLGIFGHSLITVLLGYGLAQEEGLRAELREFAMKDYNTLVQKIGAQHESVEHLFRVYCAGTGEQGDKGIRVQGYSGTR